MRILTRLLFATLTVAIGVSITPAIHAAHPLSFEERVEAQRAIEAIYHRHRIDEMRSLDEAVPHRLLEAKVRRYLSLTAALESIWNIPITTKMLELELARTTAGTRMPARLEELFSALDHDSFLIQETLIRAALVERLARTQFRSDTEIHSAAFDAAVELRQQLERGELDPHTAHPARNVHDSPEAGEDAGHVGRVIDAGEVFAIHAVLDSSADGTRVATYAVPKRSWSDWWSEAQRSIDSASVEAVADRFATLPEIGGGFSGGICQGENWDANFGPMPDRHTDHSAVWTGSEMLIWGGVVDATLNNAGLRYNPATDSWSTMTTFNAPFSRTGHAAVWTGSLMVVWGHFSDGNGQPASNTGGRYDPVADVWTPTSLVDVPAAHAGPTAIWTGSSVIFWGGFVEGGGGADPCNCCTGGNAMGCDSSICEAIVCDLDPFCCDTDWDSLCDDTATSECTCCSGGGGVGGPTNTGGRYDPVSDSWLPTATVGAPANRQGHSAIWSGDSMVVWGGSSDDGQLNTGGAYNPLNNSWIPTTTSGAPLARSSHTAVWDGESMIVWGGVGAAAWITGGRYNPVSDSWAATNITGAPAARFGHTAVWTGDEMLIWGGRDIAVVGSSGGRYDPVTNLWTALPLSGAPSPRYAHTMIWTGDEAIIWGGSSGFANGYFEVLDSGARFDPDVSSWTPTFSRNVPHGRSDATAVWTGNQMIVWGGRTNTGKTSQVNPTGGRYDPTLDQWLPTSLVDAPEKRLDHTAIWSGNEMIVWGGRDDFNNLQATGSRYNPLTDSWILTSVPGAPQARSDHSAVWAGSRMIVWGGRIVNTGAAKSGSRYNPITDSWSATSLTGAPDPRFSHSAIWAGNSMIVWGGFDASSDEFQSGSRYNSATNSWSAISTSGAPDGRGEHGAIFTGTEMIVWGGSPGGQGGGRYKLSDDSWSPISSVDAPSSSSGRSLVWSGNQMIVWGGFGVPSTGASYDPTADLWTPTTAVGSPEERLGHVAVWTGESMIVWGGFGRSDGGIYDPDGEDGDGDSIGCGLDCDDSDPMVFFAPLEIEGVRFDADEVSLEWLTQAPLVGASTNYDIVRGASSDLPVGSTSGDICLATGYTPAPGLGSNFVSLEDPATPESGDIFWYLVRAVNACGIGSYGESSAGTQRQTAVCP